MVHASAVTFFIVVTIASFLAAKLATSNFDPALAVRASQATRSRNSTSRRASRDAHPQNARSTRRERRNHTSTRINV